MSDAASLAVAIADKYRIERELGAGGMATVYLAHDIKHDRKVALKVLKPELAAVLGADRFVVEIRTTAALQHPHILPLFDSGTAGGFLFYVMPFIEGETLRSKLNRETQLGIDEAVRMASQVADALDYAHRHGVIHRDIKPENILLHDGRPMVADFGIALAVSAAAGGRMTETGLSLGTPHYMSPEQATAEKDITGRSDIYSLGSVLYEMLTGNPPHVGASAQQIIMKIITEPVEPVTKARKTVPANVAAAVARSLEKLPADRFETARAFADALGNPMYVGATMTAAASVDRRTSRRITPAFASVATLAVVAISGWVSTAVRNNHVSSTPLRLAIVVPESASVRPDFAGQNFAIAPNGSEIVYRGGTGVDRLWRRSLNAAYPVVIPGTENAGSARFSPDSKWIAYVQNGVLRKMSAAGGPPVSLADSVGSPNWGTQDQIVFLRGGAIYRISAEGGTPVRVVAPDTARGQNFAWPQLLPDGKAIVFDIVTHGLQSEAELAAVRLTDGKVELLGVKGRNPRYLKSGHLLFARLDGSIVAVPFDTKSVRITGPALTALENIYVKGGGAGEYGVSDNGTVYFVQGQSARDLVLMDLAGRPTPVLKDRLLYSNPRYSPKGDRFAIQIPDRASFSQTDIWVYNTLTKTPTRLTNDGNSSVPRWMSDGERIVWMFRDSTRQVVRRQRADGTGPIETLFAGNSRIQSVTPSPTGAGYVVTMSGTGVRDVYYADTDSSSSLRPLVATPANEGGASFSPDGQWVTYFGDESGRREVYIIAKTGQGGRHQISLNGGAEPVWGPDGKTLYYRTEGHVMSATVATSPVVAVTRRDTLFAYNVPLGTVSNWDISRDGKTFLMLGVPPTSTQYIHVVTGWLDELKQRMALATRK